MPNLVHKSVRYRYYRRKKVDKGLSCDKILGECLNSYIVKRGETNGQGLFKSYGRDGKGKKC